MITAKEAKNNTSIMNILDNIEDKIKRQTYILSHELVIRFPASMVPSKDELQSSSSLMKKILDELLSLGYSIEIQHEDPAKDAVNIMDILVSLRPYITCDDEFKILIATAIKSIRVKISWEDPDNVTLVDNRS